MFKIIPYVILLCLNSPLLAQTNSTLQADKAALKNVNGLTLIAAKGNVVLISSTYALSCDQLQGMIDPSKSGALLDKFTQLVIYGNVIITTQDRELTTTRALLNSVDQTIFFPEQIHIKDLTRKLSTTASNALYNIKTRSFGLANAKTTLPQLEPLDN